MSVRHQDETSAPAGLIGYWPLRGDCRDHSGHGHHGINHGVDLATGSFAGRGCFIEVPGHPGLKLGGGDFTLAVWIHMEPRLDTAVGDVLAWCDPARRRGLTLSIQASAGGYCAQGDDRHVQFGIDNGRDVEWEECGRPGDCIEVNGQAVYNGRQYAGTIPRAELFRYENDGDWTSLRRFFAPEGWEPASVDEAATSAEGQAELNEWTRVTSLTVFGGKLFAGIGSCTSSIEDAPCDVRGQVFAMEAGKCVSYDRDLGPGWKHLAAVREGGRLKLYVDGRLEGVSAAFDPGEYDLTLDAPLHIGSGEPDSFSGKIREVRVYSHALGKEEIERFCQAGRPE